MKLSSLWIACALFVGIGAAHADTIAFPPQAITFADTALGASSTFDFTFSVPPITGTSSTRLHAEITGDAFSLLSGSDLILAPGSTSALFELAFQPQLLGTSLGTLFITVTDFNVAGIPLATGTASISLEGSTPAPVPGPPAGAGVPGLLLAIVGLWAMRRMRWAAYSLGD